MDSDFHKIVDNEEEIINPDKVIIIGEKVWIGCCSIILKGARIANESVIAANTLVSKNISQKPGVYAGNPAELKRENISWTY